MSNSLFRNVSKCDQDNLIARVYPRALTTAVKIAAGAGALKRGTILSAKDDGTYEVMKSGGTPAYILVTDVDASGAEPVAAAVYRSGNFNPKAVIVADGYALTAADKDTLRKYGIVFTYMLED